MMTPKEHTKWIGRGSQYQCTICKDKTDPKAHILHLDGESNWCEQHAQLFRAEHRIKKSIKNKGITAKVKTLFSFFSL